MRLIDADAFQRDIARMCVKRCHLYENDNDFPNCGECVANFIYEMLKKAPTIEAKPVVHAHWKEYYPPKEFILTGEEKLYICSNCDAKYSHIENQRFCPWCGALMEKFATDTNGGSKINATTTDAKIPVISMEDVPKIMEEMEK